jgi:hypothetical protein
MALISLNKPLMCGRVPMGEEGGRLLQFGQFQFTGTDATGELPIQMRQIDALIALPAQQEVVAKQIAMVIGSVSATGAFTLLVPFAATLTAVNLVQAAAVSTSDTNYWTFGLVNKTQTLTPVDASAAGNTTKATGGSALAAYTNRQLTLSGTAANLAITAYDVLEFTFTKTSSPTTLTEVFLMIEFSAAGGGLWAPELVNGTQVVKSAGTVTVSRANGPLNSGAVHDYLAIGR